VSERGTLRGGVPGLSELIAGHVREEAAGTGVVGGPSNLPWWFITTQEGYEQVWRPALGLPPLPHDSSLVLPEDRPFLYPRAGTTPIDRRSSTVLSRARVRR
jgi:hypothetical protein